MKKIFVFFFLLTITNSVYSQEYSINFTKPEMINYFRELNTSIIKTNQQLIQLTKKLQNDPTKIISEEGIDYINNDVQENIIRILYYGFLYAGANVQDFEMNNELDNCIALVETQSELYEQLENAHINNLNISYRNANNYDELIQQALDMFIGVPFFSMINQFRK